MTTKRNHKNESQKWCKTCRIWIANNKVQIEQHEKGTKHQQALEKLLKEISMKNEVKRSESLAKNNSNNSEQKGKSGQAATDLFERITRFHQQKELDNVKTINQKENDDDCIATNKTNVLRDEYPAPATAVYGEWVTVEDEEQTEQQDETNKSDEEDGNDDNLSTDKDNLTHEQIEPTFKRRKLGTTRRKRRRIK